MLYNDPVGAVTITLPLFVPGCVALVALTTIVAICVKGCGKKKNRSNDVFSGEEEKLPNGSNKNEDIEKNGDVHQNGRLLSHDRALPEIPVASSGITSTDDDEEEDEGHYDFISKSKKASANAYFKNSQGGASAVTGPVTTVTQHPLKPVRSHPYEKVGGDPDSDSTYAGLKGDASGESGGSYAPPKTDPHQERGGAPPFMLYCSSKSGTSAVSIDPVSHHNEGDVATSSGVLGEQVYSVVGDRSDRPVGGRRAARSKGLHLPGASGTSGAETGALFPTAHPPPVPDKRYSSGTEDNLVSPGSMHGGGATAVNQSTSSSPSLPPRNSDGFMNAPPPPSVWSTEMSSSVGRSFFGSAASAVPLPLQWSTADQFPLIDDDVVDGSPTDTLALSVAAAAAAAPAKRVPDYSSVSARESLENLRKRQQASVVAARSTLTDLQEGAYDTIDYDKIKTPAGGATSSGACVAENVYSNGSDLYAEIGTGPNSARSSTYAQVGSLSRFGGLAGVNRDEGGSGGMTTRPVLPSVDALQQIMHATTAFDPDDIADPGYSRLDGQRVRSVVNPVPPVLPSLPSPHPPPPTNNSVPHSTTGGSTGGLRSPVYAVVSKNQRNHRQTVHVDSDISHRGGGYPGGDNAGEGATPGRGNLYAQVARNRTHRRSSSNDPSLVGSAYSAINIGAVGGAELIVPPPSSGLLRNNSSYASIDSVIAGQGSRSSDDTSRNVGGERAGRVYDVPTGDIVNPGFDRLYEDVRESHLTNGLNVGGAYRGVGESLSIEHYAARPSSTSPRGSGAHRSPPPQLLIREHIYEVVSESRRRPWDRTDEPERINHRPTPGTVVANGDIHPPRTQLLLQPRDVVDSNTARSHDQVRTANRNDTTTTDL